MPKTKKDRKRTNNDFRWKATVTFVKFESDEQRNAAYRAFARCFLMIKGKEKNTCSSAPNS